MASMLDWTAVLTSVLVSTALSSVVTGIIAPSINWGIEKKRLTRTDRKEKIHKRRKMVQDVALAVNKIERGDAPPITDVRSLVAYFLEKELDFYSLKPVLSQISILGAKSGKWVSAILMTYRLPKSRKSKFVTEPLGRLLASHTYGG
jgi:hypothetical protein